MPSEEYAYKKANREHYASCTPRAIRKQKLKQRFGNRLDETIKHTQEKLDLLLEIKEDFRCRSST